MIKTKPENYLVHKIKRTYIWLEVLEGEDAGIRVSVPRYSSAYSDKIQEQVNSLSKGEIQTFVLVSKDEVSPNWYIARIGSDGVNKKRQR